MEKKLKPGPKPMPEQGKKVTRHYCVKRKYEAKAVVLVDSLIAAINEGKSVKIQNCNKVAKINFDN